MTRRMERIVVVGTGLAGIRAAERLRELGFGGELTLVGSESGWPCHRPALSKEVLKGTLRAREVGLTLDRDLGVRWRHGTSALRLDPRRRIVVLPGAEELGYDGLVIATGTEPRRLAMAPHHDPRIHVLRDVSDTVTLKCGLAAARGLVVVVGGGFLGCELASSLRELGREVLLISRSEHLLGHVVGPVMGQWITSLHRDKGVHLALGVRVVQLMSNPSAMIMRLSNGQVLETGCVVVAIGSLPNVEWLRTSGVVVDDGVVCQPTCHVLGATDVVAAGDVAKWPNPRFDGRARRVEHWFNAVEMGRAAAENLIAGPAAARPYSPIPRSWSEQHGVRIQVAGMPWLGTDAVDLAAPTGGRSGVTGYLCGRRLVGLVGVDSPQAVLAWTTELARQTDPGRVPALCVGRAIPQITAGTGDGQRTEIIWPTERDSISLGDNQCIDILDAHRHGDCVS